MDYVIKKRRFRIGLIIQAKWKVRKKFIYIVFEFLDEEELQESKSNYQQEDQQQEQKSDKC